MEMLSYKGFELLLMQELDKRYPEMKKTTKEMVKINEQKQGIIIECANGICVTIYPENLYEVYKLVFEEMNFMDIILESVDAALKYEFVKEYKSMLYKWDDIKQYVKPFVFNLEKNREYIKQNQIVFREKLNLAYCCFLDFPEDELGGTAQVNVSRNLLELWEISEEELFETAESNAIFCIKSMKETIEEIIQDKSGVEVNLGERSMLYVISTPKRYRGAAGIFRTELLEKHAVEIDDNFYILPSSMHEVILVKEQDAPSVEVLKDMVQDVNETQVMVEEYLADSIYYYERKIKEVKIVG